MVRLSVSDTGHGMADEVRARIYEPFFTTKEVGKGTGLGLPMVFAIVRQHKGWIDCWSEVGQGTRFDIYLPRCDPPKATEHHAVETSAYGNQSEKATILVVDDEELIRRVASMTLTAAGYTVIEATDGQHAIEVYRQESERIGLVLLDLTMPTLSGHDAFRTLLKINRDIKVLFASGYAAEQLSDMEKQLMAGFVKKPYRPSDLLKAVEEALSRSSQYPPSSAQSDRAIVEPLAV
jgi:CheY-like chemotaxis protein